MVKSSMLNKFQRCLDTMLEGLPTKRWNEYINDGLKESREKFKPICGWNSIEESKHDKDKSKGE